MQIDELNIETNQPRNTAQKIVDLLQASGLTWCALSGYHSYPISVETDLDILVYPKDFGKITDLIRSLPGAWVIQEKWHEWLCRTFTVTDDPCGAPGSFVSIDIMATHTYHGLPIMPAVDILADRRKSRNGLWVSPPEGEFIYYLTKRIVKSAQMPAEVAFGEEQINKLRNLYMRSPARCRRKLEQHFSEPTQASIVSACESGDFRTTTDRLPAYLTELKRTIWRRHPFSTARSHLLNALRLLARSCRPNGLMIAVLGPDGAGKSTLIKAFPAQLHELFDRYLNYHLWPETPADSFEAGTSVVYPYANPARGKFLSTVQLVYWWLKYTVGYWTKNYPALVRQSCVIFDRYHLDMQCDPTRYRYGGFHWMTVVFSRLLPGADLYLVLDVDPETGARRQPEMSRAELSRQRQAYLKLAASRSDCAVIDATRQPRDIADAARAEIIRLMAQRVRHKASQWT